MAQMRARQVEQQNIKLSSMVRYFRSKAAQSAKGVNKALSVLQKLSSEPPVIHGEEEVQLACHRALEPSLAVD